MIIDIKEIETWCKILQENNKIASKTHNKNLAKLL
jgi:hypothetical protein